MEWGPLKKLRNSRSGGIEGLPLQLMIIILIATLGTGIILGWMGSIETPKFIGSVSAEDDVIRFSDQGTVITVTVTDQNGDPLEGAVVSLTGCGIRNSDGSPVSGVTDRRGAVIFSDLRITNDQKIRYIDIEAVKPDYGSKRSQIVVMP